MLHTRQAAGETRYWLEVFAGLVPKEKLNRLNQEALKLSVILQKISSSFEESNNQVSGNNPNGK